jgi:hypothetical protein
MENYYQAMNEYAEAIEADEYFESINNPSL